MNVNLQKMKDDDKSSQYTIISASSPLLIAILLGSCGLFYLIYEKINLKEMISKCSELFTHRSRFLESSCS